LFAAFARNAFIRRAKELAEERVVEQRRQPQVFAHRFGGVNVSPRWANFFE